MIAPFDFARLRLATLRTNGFGKPCLRSSWTLSTSPGRTVWKSCYRSSWA